MGTSSSSLHELRDNKYLQQFSGKEPISPNDPFWNQLLSFTFAPPHSCADCRLLEDSIRPMLDALLNSNPITGNVAALIKVFLVHSSELKAAVQCENKVFIWQAYNSLFILRCILKYFIETLGEEGTLKQLEDVQQNKTDPNNASEPEKLLESAINALFEIIVDISLDSKTYAITVEAVHTLIVLLSVQMFSSRSAHLSTVYQIIMRGECAAHSSALIKTLLTHYSNQDMCPHCITAVEGGSIIAGLASGLWNVLTLNYAGKNSPKDLSSVTVLANHSLLLLLILVNHCTNDKEMKNPYRAALFSFKNSNGTSDGASKDEIAAFKLDFDILFKTLCNTLKDDQTALLAYLLLHQNPNFRQYIIFSSEIYLLVMPLLKLLYNAPDKNSHLIYMTLIILLILSEEEYFDKQIHSIKLRNVTWYTERMLSEISLGSMIVLILIRTIQFNMTRMHDKYLHTNCLAALANMSAHIQNLHTYVCDKFINLLESMGKRYIRITEQSKSGSRPVDDELLPSDLMQDLSVLDEVLRMLLEILNSCLTFQLRNNINLLYTILYKKDIFSMFRSNANFQDIMQNIDIVLLFFSPHLESVEQNVSVLEVTEIIKSVCLQWSKEKMKKLPELKFKYVEEGQPEDFFIPYLWSVVFHSSDIYWNSKNILIFNPYKQA
ncbi:dymeclin-like [Argiope bruennichi]|uniref:Dymeclin n=1 Tax=Argiope bruennichi TaxID=94029 RepID=A0A8T0F5G3_ARGBR|nr:dymeclin-like [Argiope bruennichi]XP_055926518.1 dymeclin-like [Argiope bruennichi]XP_055926520.1 dymeclin-like [Argiope bruennichi]KAF8784660.1 Dymeclin like protein [Argiope bruennichi]